MSVWPADDHEGSRAVLKRDVARDAQSAFLEAMNQHRIGDSERLTEYLEECESKWDRLFRDAPVVPAPPGLTKTQAVVRAAQEKVQVMMPDEESAEFLTNFFTESELKLYRMRLQHDCKEGLMKDVVQLLRDPSFDPDDVRDGVHSKFQALIQV